ncbi:hypothetical protein ABPG75_012073 [Micractinium tetrahymenae]
MEISPRTRARIARDNIAKAAAAATHFAGGLSCYGSAPTYTLPVDGQIPNTADHGVMANQGNVVQHFKSVFAQGQWIYMGPPADGFMVAEGVKQVKDMILGAQGAGAQELAARVAKDSALLQIVPSILSGLYLATSTEPAPVLEPVVGAYIPGTTERPIIFPNSPADRQMRGTIGVLVPEELAGAPPAVVGLAVHQVLSQQSDEVKDMFQIGLEPFTKAFDNELVGTELVSRPTTSAGSAVYFPAMDDMVPESAADLGQITGDLSDWGYQGRRLGSITFPLIAGGSAFEATGFGVVLVVGASDVRNAYCVSGPVDKAVQAADGTRIVRKLQLSTAIVSAAATKMAATANCPLKKPVLNCVVQLTKRESNAPRATFLPVVFIAAADKAQQEKWLGPKGKRTIRIPVGSSLISASVEAPRVMPKFAKVAGQPAK